MFNKDIKISLLLDFYGDTLNERRRELMELYYNEDYSLSEISENTGISRQGVRDSVKKGETQLLLLEEKLGLAKKFSDIKRQTEHIAAYLLEISAETDNILLKEKLHAISNELLKIDI